MDIKRVKYLVSLLESYSNKEVLLKEDSFVSNNNEELIDCIKTIFKTQLNQSDINHMVNEWHQQPYDKQSIQTGENALNELRQRIIYLIKKINKQENVSSDSNLLHELKNQDNLKNLSIKHSFDISQCLKFYVPKIKSAINLVIRILKENHVLE